MKHEREIRGFLEQSHISKKNVARLEALASTANKRIADLATVVLEVAMVTPYRRYRIKNLARQHRDVLVRMEQVGLIPPLAEEEETDPHGVDKVAAGRLRGSGHHAMIS